MKAHWREIAWGLVGVVWTAAGYVDGGRADAVLSFVSYAFAGLWANLLFRTCKP